MITRHAQSSRRTHPTLEKATVKKILVLATLAAASMGAQAACTIPIVIAKHTGVVFEKHGGWAKDTDRLTTLCEKLRKNRARVSVLANATVLGEQSIGWAALSIVDLDSEIGTIAFASLHTSTDSYASADTADQLMVRAVNLAAQNWSAIDKALADLDVERKRARRGR